jgi:hypothetical protein
VPEDERGAILLDDAALNGELLRMIDAYPDKLFPVTPFEAGRVVFPVSRLVCDVERFPSDETSPWRVGGWACSTPAPRWAARFGRNRVPQSGSPSWIDGAGRIVRSWSAA